jgi:nitroimidazol reductase NimA-like FMN-containing flavoprotein (pyridoxamine 5'-phosphate oxidase superfamily)
MMMLDIDEMGSTEILELLQKVSYGHLGCINEGKPYVIPMHYYIEDTAIYLFTTEGMKSHDMDTNPDVCLQVEEIHDLEHWRSAIVMGRAEHIREQQEIDRVMKFVKTQNPTLSPALNRTWTDAWGRGNVIEIYRIHPSEMTGRTTQGVSSRPLRS